MAISLSRKAPANRALRDTLRRLPSEMYAKSDAGHLLRTDSKPGNAHLFHGCAAYAVLVRSPVSRQSVSSVDLLL